MIFPDEVVYGAALSLTGTLGPGCVFESSFPDTADSFEIAALQSTDADWLFKYFELLQFSVDEATADSRVVSGMISIRKLSYRWGDMDGSPHTEDPGYVLQSITTITSETVEMRVEKI